MWFCITLTLSSTSNPCQSPFLSNFEANCSDSNNHYCLWDEWMCVVHQHRNSLTGACLSNTSGCLLNFDSTTGTCFGECANHNELFGLVIAIIVLGILLCVVIFVFICVGLCCCCGCCGCIARQSGKCCCSKQKHLTDDGISENLLQSSDSIQTGIYPGAVPAIIRGSPIQGYFMPFPQPEVVGQPGGTQNQV
jgi:hypothetical protein